MIQPPRAVVGGWAMPSSAFVFLRIVAACYLREGEQPVTLVKRSAALQVGLVGCCVAILLIGLWPRGLMSMARQPFHGPQTTATLVHVPGSRHSPAGVAGPMGSLRARNQGAPTSRSAMPKP